MKKTVIYSLLVNTILFLILLLFTHPIYNTDEDVYVAYFLGGGFGSPTALLHYNHLMHPVLGLALKALTELTQSINWYTASLFAAHFLACCIIFNQVLNARSRITATVAYITVFVLIEAKFLLVPNFSNTSVICSCAAAGLMFNSRSFIPVILMLALGSLFRIHPLIPVACLTLLLVFTSFPYRRSLSMLGATILAGVVIFGLNMLHQAYYESRIPNWKAEDNYRQHIYDFYNHHVTGLKPGDKWYDEVELINNGLPLDTTYLSVDKLTLIIKETAGTRKPVQITSTNLYWFSIEHRILIITLILFLLFGGLSRKHFFSVAITLLAAVGGWLYLIYNMKLPEYVLISTFMILFLFISIFGRDQPSQSKMIDYGKVALMCAVILWGLIQLRKRDTKNETGITAFKKAYSEIHHHSNQLFISIGGAFPLQKFPAWAPPSKYPINNLLTGEHFLHNLHQPLLSKFPPESIRYLGDSLILKRR